ncbi:uncharacterized protein LOC113316662 [Papaver somniferum]|uniref:uncharacterized protein LOC113316662 n=1 Tax=Papaver somniferum TaxID=3469 RepID=UPI000E7033CE|nr:uncharacterized protein LOC113316662 [Papaver somniferum]
MAEKSNTDSEFLVPAEEKCIIGRSMWQIILKSKEDLQECIEIKVRKVIGNGWTLSFSRVLNPTERIDLLELKDDLNSVFRQEGEEDFLEGDFSSKKLFELLNREDVEREFTELLEIKHIPPKVSFLFWAGFDNSIPTRVMLEHRGVHIASNMCLFCNGEPETQIHLFMHCPGITDIWNYFINSCKVTWVMPQSLTSLLQIWNTFRFNGVKKDLQKLIPFAVVWVIWLERNDGMHGRRHKSDEEIKMSIKQTLHLWTVKLRSFGSYYVNQVLTQWETVISV